MRILIIEDDPDVRDTVSCALESMFPSAEITSLADGSEFLGVFKDSIAWDFIVLDIMLPGKSGVEICRLIRAGSGADTPVLAMTGYDTPDMEKRIREAGATMYMAKPFEMEDFIRTVRKIMEAYGEKMGCK